MAFISKGLEHEEDYVLYKLFDEISYYVLATNKNQYAFTINKCNGIDEKTGQRNVTYTSKIFPIREVVYEPPKLDTIPYHENKFTLKERIKILLKGKL